MRVSGPMWEPVKYGYWKSLHDKDGAHYNSYGLTRDDLGMAALRELFPDGLARENDFVFFSTSGVHGHYSTIEEAEGAWRAGPESWEEGIPPSVTFLILQTRIACTRCGNCQPQSEDDFLFLKKLRSSSSKRASEIGWPSAR